MDGLGDTTTLPPVEGCSTLLAPQSVPGLFLHHLPSEVSPLRQSLFSPVSTVSSAAERSNCSAALILHKCSRDHILPGTAVGDALLCSSAAVALV